MWSTRVVLVLETFSCLRRAQGYLKRGTVQQYVQTPRLLPLHCQACLPQTNFFVACVDAGFSLGAVSWNTLVECVKLHINRVCTQSHPNDGFLRTEEREICICRHSTCKYFYSKLCQLSHLIKKHTSLGIEIQMLLVLGWWFVLVFFLKCHQHSDSNLQASSSSRCLFPADLIQEGVLLEEI